MHNINQETVTVEIVQVSEERQAALLKADGGEPRWWTFGQLEELARRNDTPEFWRGLADAVADVARGVVEAVSYN